MSDDLFTAPPPPPPRSNVPEMSVSELSFSLKRTLEETYGRVRVRGELSRVKIHTSGHLYTDLKDENALINAVCWKATLAKFKIKPEEGLEVICTGRVSTYPQRSNYQLIIESMELAGAGALLKMLEERKKRLASEGLFDPARKKPLPFLPDIIGVVTSPTGAVIRDIMHRLNDRFPRHVLLYPVLVQGDGAADQIAKAIRAFDSIKGAMRPDLIVVARGGGSLEDLMAFNEENVVRAVAECSIPVISAVGHETDTTLIDFAADIRAPTPTAAAEMAVPERLASLAHINDGQSRMTNGLRRLLTERRHRMESIAARLGNPAKLLENKTQRIDHLAHKLSAGFERGLSLRQTRLATLGGKIRHPQDRVNDARRRLDSTAERLISLVPKLTSDPQRRLDQTTRMLESLSFKSVLARGYVVVRDADGKAVPAAENLTKGQSITLQFRDEKTVAAEVKN